MVELSGFMWKLSFLYKLSTIELRYIIRKITKKKYPGEKYHEKPCKKEEQELDDFTKDFKA